ncbi:MAG: hypothetical protein PHC61_13195 [Chitinivibrionales bacterium]|nr:hypothetical protein [Chitinivibrionales bacterium]
MATLNRAQTAGPLGRIKERYAAIHAITQDACANPEPFNIIGVLDKRDTLLREIAEDSAALPEKTPGDDMREINALLTRIHDCDIILMHILQTYCDETGEKLRTCNSTFSAASRYITNSSIYFRRKK